MGSQTRRVRRNHLKLLKGNQKVLEPFEAGPEQGFFNLMAGCVAAVNTQQKEWKPELRVDRDVMIAQTLRLATAMALDAENPDLETWLGIAQEIYEQEWMKRNPRSRA
jgi:hypothetical protein